MSWRFRQSFKVLPGLKLHLSRTGLSASIGVAPFTLNLGPRGLNGTASIPGTGIQFRQRLAGNSVSEPGTALHGQIPLENRDWPDGFPPQGDSGPSTLSEVRSASTELLTSDSLRDLKLLIQTAFEEHEEIVSQLSKAKQEKARSAERFKAWDSGFLLKRLFKSSFEVRRAEAEIAAARASELEEQLGLTSISTQVELAKEQAGPFYRLRDDFTALSECAAIWDVKAEGTTDKFRERTVANTTVSRERVKLRLATCDLIRWHEEVPHFTNANGGDIFLYPGFILYRASKMAFSVIDFHDVKLTATLLKFHEAQGVPSDSEVVGQTWTKTNKDGTRDKRFASNFQIPIVLYGELALRSDTGLWEKFLFSDPARMERFVKSWSAFVASFNHKVSLRVDQELVAPPIPDVPDRGPWTVVGANVHFECSACGQPIEVNAEAAGQEFRCPGCGAKLAVPGVSV
jgi:DNA-directed RNA polymerase subunit RPC12/RpoP